MRVLRSTNRIYRDLDIATRAVLEPHGARQTTRKLPMALTLRCAGTDRSPTDQVGDVLR